MTDIVAFLAARLDEDETDALAAIADRSETARWEAHGWLESGRMEWIVRDAAEKYASHGYPGHTPVAQAMPGGPRGGGGLAAHIARHDPASVLRKVTAERQLLVLHEHAEATENGAYAGDFGCQTCHYDRGDAILLGLGWCDTLRIMAAPYDAHPDYDPAWRVE